LNSVRHTDVGLQGFESLAPEPGLLTPVLDFQRERRLGLIQGDIWNLDSMVANLQEAYRLLEQGRNYEHCLEVLSFLVAVWKRERNYAEMQENLKLTKQVCTTIIQKEKERENTLFARYYHISFFGKKLGKDLDGVDFIYKRPTTCIIAKFQTEMTCFLSSFVNGKETDVVLLPNNISVDRSTLDEENKVYFQLCSTDPCPQSKKSGPKTRQQIVFDRNFGAKQFISVLAFTKDGSKAQSDDLREQRKKKTVYTTENAFPSVNTRSRVVSRSETILEPLENATELITERCAKILAQLESNPPRVNPLQQVLQGSITPMVNEGPLKICETFLSLESRTETPEMRRLQLAMSNFTDLCAAGLELDSVIITAKYQKFHAMLQDQFNGLYQKIMPYLADCPYKPKKTYTRDEIDRKAWRDLPEV